MSEEHKNFPTAKPGAKKGSDEEEEEEEESSSSEEERVPTPPPAPVAVVVEPEVQSSGKKEEEDVPSFGAFADFSSQQWDPSGAAAEGEEDKGGAERKMLHLDTGLSAGAKMATSPLTPEELDPNNLAKLESLKESDA